MDKSKNNCTPKFNTIVYDFFFQAYHFVLHYIWYDMSEIIIQTGGSGKLCSKTSHNLLTAIKRMEKKLENKTDVEK